jgi:hypothetical protein
MNIDELLRQADPAAGISLPHHDSPLANSSFEKMTARAPNAHSYRRCVTARVSIAAVAAAGVAIGLVNFIPGEPAPASAAAIVLDQAAASAARGRQVVLSPGQYLYTQTRSFSITTYGINDHGIYVGYVSTTQTWETASGIGKTVTTVNSPAKFARGSRAQWIAAGRPNLGIPAVGHAITSVIGPRDAAPLDNLSHLPTDPRMLKQEIEQRKTGLADINVDVEDPASPGGAFYVAALILENPSVGSSPALRSALFKVMASLPGDRVLGKEKTQSGRAGIAILTAPLGDQGTDVFKIIVDPKNGQVLEDDEYAHAGGPVDQWDEYLSTGVVQKIGQLPGD